MTVRKVLVLCSLMALSVTVWRWWCVGFGRCRRRRRGRTVGDRQGVDHTREVAELLADLVAMGGQDGDLGPRLGEQGPRGGAELVGLGPGFGERTRRLVLGAAPKFPGLVLHPGEIVGRALAHRLGAGLGLGQAAFAPLGR